MSCAGFVGDVFGGDVGWEGWGGMCMIRGGMGGACVGPMGWVRYVYGSVASEGLGFALRISDGWTGFVCWLCFA